MRLQIFFRDCFSNLLEIAFAESQTFQIPVHNSQICFQTVSCIHGKGLYAVAIPLQICMSQLFTLCGNA